MTHTRQMSDAEGDFSGWEDTDKHCGKPVPEKNDFCGAPVKVRKWESSCGGWEDYQYRCANGHTWWVDGIDS